jgi:ABC-2 type transport system permease protein
MIPVLGRTAAAELLKLRSLPAAVATAAGTVVIGAILAAALASSAPATPSAASTSAAPDAVIQAVPFLQIGPIVIGVLTVASEYAGRQIVTTLAATPDRLRLLAAKTVAYLVAATIISVATIGGGLAAAWLVIPVRAVAVWPMAGAAVYLVVIGLLSLGLAAVLRSLVPPLVIMLALLLIVSPLLAGYTEHARWLPDRAGSLLYRPDADAMIGAVVLVAWIAVTASAAIATFLRRDA